MPFLCVCERKNIYQNIRYICTLYSPIPISLQVSQCWIFSHSFCFADLQKYKSTCSFPYLGSHHVAQFWTTCGMQKKRMDWKKQFLLIGTFLGKAEHCKMPQLHLTLLTFTPVKILFLPAPIYPCPQKVPQFLVSWCCSMHWPCKIPCVLQLTSICIVSLWIKLCGLQQGGDQPQQPLLGFTHEITAFSEGLVLSRLFEQFSWTEFFFSHILIKAPSIDPSNADHAPLKFTGEH